MTRDGRRNRIPTSDELEQQGALAPAVEDGLDKRGGLLRFFRGSRLRVSEDVAARKHVGASETRASVVTQERRTPPSPTAPSRPEATAPVRPAESIVPRRIRMDPSVKERRGLGKADGARGSDT
jgi:hypothetical protein